MFFTRKKLDLPTADTAMIGRTEPLRVTGTHFVNGTSIQPPFPDVMEQAVFGMGCFWGAERLFWQIPGVHTTAVGYAGGFTENASYEEVCSGATGHTEAVLVVYDPAKVAYRQLLQVFWEEHDPTQGMRQGNDVGTQYRSAVYTFDAAQAAAAAETKDMFQARLGAAGFGSITTEIAEAGPFYYAEDYHQQYLAKNPNGYCGIDGTGVSCPVGLEA